MSKQTSKPNGKPKEIKLHLTPTIMESAKNTDGILGDKCDSCGGFGFTISTQGKKLSCIFCESTGVKLPTNKELQQQISDLRKDLYILKKALLDTLGMNGVEIRKDLRKVTNA